MNIVDLLSWWIIILQLKYIRYLNARVTACPGFLYDKKIMSE